MTNTLQTPSVLLMGPPGSGKTHSLSTIIEAGLELFVISTEPGGMETLLDACASKRLPLSKLHYRILPPARTGFAGISKMAKNISQFNFDALSKMSPTQRNDAQFLAVAETCQNFKCDHCGAEFGDISKFDSSRSVALDSLSGLSSMAMDLAIGDKVTAHQGEWGVAMGILDKLILALTSNLNSLFVLTAHLAREQDEVTGGTKIMVHTLGRKLAPSLPRFFSEVVLASAEAGKYYWNTTGVNIDLKHRALPLGSKLDPTFKPVIEKYQQRLKLITEQTQPQLTQPVT